MSSPRVARAAAAFAHALPNGFRIERAIAILEETHAALADLGTEPAGGALAAELPADSAVRGELDAYLRLTLDQPAGRLKFLDHQSFPDTSTKGRRVVEATITDGGKEIQIAGTGTGPIDGFVDALSKHIGVDLTVLDYSEHSMQRGSNAAAISYVEVEHPGGKLFGAGINTNIVAASLEAVVSAANRILGAR